LKEAPISVITEMKEIDPSCDRFMKEKGMPGLNVEDPEMMISGGPKVVVNEQVSYNLLHKSAQ
jgi:hypothetical protein